MHRILLLAASFLLAVATPAFADEARHRQLAEQLMEIHHAREMLEEAADKVKDRLLSRFAEVAATSRDKQAVAAGKEQATKLIDAEFSWDNLKQDYVQMYVDFFTEDELQAIVDFSNSPAGRKLQDVTPALLMKSAAIGQQHSRAVEPKVERIIGRLKNGQSP